MSGALRPHSNGWDENRKFKVLLKEGKLFFYRKKKKKKTEKQKQNGIFNQILRNEVTLELVCSTLFPCLQA